MLAVKGYIGTIGIKGLYHYMLVSLGNGRRVGVKGFYLDGGIEGLFYVM